MADDARVMMVRPLRHTDRPSWAELWDGYNAFYGREGTTALPAAVTEMTWSRFFDPDQPVHALVAETSGSLVGLAHFVFHRSTTHIDPVCYLQDLFTTQASRGMGVGRALIEAVCATATAAGSRRLYWQTHETNVVAMRLYDQVAEKSGFIVYRRDLGVRPTSPAE
jgi:GNAT superfamily N-acetyltransferase